MEIETSVVLRTWCPAPVSTARTDPTILMVTHAHRFTRRAQRTVFRTGGEAVTGKPEAPA